MTVADSLVMNALKFHLHAETASPKTVAKSKPQKLD
jgi:hypothetical protein